MKKRWLLVAMIGLSMAGNAQNDCGCPNNLKHLINKVENNYAGYQDKVNSSTQQAYSQLKTQLLTQADTASSLLICFEVLNSYRAFFYDKHLQLSPHFAVPAKGTIDQPIQKPIMLAGFTEDSIRILLTKKQQQKKIQALEGIWTTDGYTVGIVYNPAAKAFQSIILQSQNNNWQPQMEKFRATPIGNGYFSVTYKKGNYTADNTQGYLFKNILEVEKYGLWKKQWPVATDTITVAAYQANESKLGDVQVRFLNNGTAYIALKSCDLSLKAPLEALLKKYQQRLSATANWIIDVRGNQGGSTDVYTALLPYLYTKPLISKGNRHWMTVENTMALDEFVMGNKDQLDSSTYQYLMRMINYGKANPGAWFDDHGDTTAYPKVLAYPKRVAVLSDRYNASSGETFVMVAAGLSDKVTTFGEASAGYLDYGDLLPYAMPCKEIDLYIPSRRANYNDDGVHYDKTGYPVQVAIPTRVNDWIAWVQQYWKQHPTVKPTRK